MILDELTGSFARLGWQNAIALGLSVIFVSRLFSDRKLSHIPTIGHSLPILSFFSGVKFLWAAKQRFEEGYRKYPNQVWKTRMIDEWLIVANGTQKVEDMRKASEDVLSGVQSNTVFYQFDCTLGPEVTSNPYHVNVIRGPLTRSLPSRFEEMREEMILAFDEMIKCPSDGKSVEVPLFETLVEIISRTSSRMFVGLPLCRNTEFRELGVQGVMELVKGRFLHLFPVPLRAFIGRKITNVEGTLVAIEKHIAPTLIHRLEQEELHGSEWTDKPNDIFSWTIDAARSTGQVPSSREVAKRMMLYAFASTHTTAVSFLQVLLALLVRPEYISILREEVEGVVREEGWTKTSMGRLHKMDSFMREAQRFYGLGLGFLTRRVLKDFTFSDGTVIPAGSFLCVNSWSMHHDETLYPQPESFDGLRFYKEDGKEQPLMATPTLEYTVFGHGRPACPGRFFAVSEMKVLLAHILWGYEVRIADNASPKFDRWLETKVIPDSSINVLFQKRG